MPLRLISQLLAILVLLLAAAMAVPGALAWWFGEGDAARAFRDAGLTSGALGLVLLALGGVRRHEVVMTHRGAFLAVTLAWVMSGVVGGIPFLFSGHFGGVTNSVFESVSGFTTTGATILQDIEAVPKSLLFWRATTHWVGGMGIVLLSVAILPILGVGGMELFKAEVPGPTADKLSPRIIQTARVLWRTYLVLTVAEVVALMVCGLDLFDAVCHAFATVATGGFSTKNASVETFASPAVEGVIVFFMFLAGTSFSLHFTFVRSGLKRYLRDIEFRVYVLIILVATALTTLSLWLSGVYDVVGSFRRAIFQVVSLTTTTGFSSADFEAWALVHALAPFVMFCLFFVGGCAGSTGGGVKVVRVWLLFKGGVKELFRQIHPRAVTQVRLGNRVVPREVFNSVSAFFVLYAFLFGFSALLLAAMGLDFETALSASASAIGNIGPGFGDIGPLDNYSGIPDAGKVLLMVLMLLGRLELYTILVLFVPEYWRR